MGTILGNTQFSIKKCALSFFGGHFSLFIGSNISLTQIISSKLYYLISYGKTNPGEKGVKNMMSKAQLKFTGSYKKRMCS